MNWRHFWVYKKLIYLQIGDYCPTCFYNAGRKLGESIGPMMMAVGVACITSSFIVYGLLY